MTFSLSSGTVSLAPNSTLNPNDSTNYILTGLSSGSQLTVSMNWGNVSKSGSIAADSVCYTCGMWVDPQGRLWHVNDHGIVGLVF